MDLFDYMRSNTMEKEAPLASRLRPATLDELSLIHIWTWSVPDASSQPQLNLHFDMLKKT